MTKYRYLAFAKESTWLDDETTTEFQDFVKESMSHDRSMNLPITAGFMEPARQSTGKYKASGSIDMLTVPDEIGIFLNMLFGQALTSTRQGSTAAYKHTWRPLPTAPYYTMDICKDDYVRSYFSTICKKWNLKLLPGMDAYSTFDLLSPKDIIGVQQVPTFTSYLDSLHFTGWDTNLGGSDNAIIKALEYNFEVAIDEDDFRRESQFAMGFPRQEFRTTMTMDLAFTSEAELKRFYDGATGVVPADEITPFDPTTQIIGKLIESTYYYTLTITTPQVVFKTEKANIDARKFTIQNLTAEAIYATNQTAAVKVKLTNRDTAY